MPAEALDYHDLLVVVLDARVRLRLERALVELPHFPLPPLHGNPLVLLLQLRSDSVLVRGSVTVVRDNGWHAFIQLRVLGVRLRLEGQLLVLLLFVLLLSGLELVLGRHAHRRAILVLVLVDNGSRCLIDARLECQLAVHLRLLQLADHLLLLRILEIQPVYLGVFLLGATLRIILDDDRRCEIDLRLESALRLLAVLVRYLLLLFHLLFQELVLPLVEVLQAALEHLVALRYVLARLRNAWLVSSTC